jgi:hypothetical protein
MGTDDEQQRHQEPTETKPVGIVGTDDRDRCGECDEGSARRTGRR